MFHAPTPQRCLLITLSVSIAAVTNSTAQTQLQTPTLVAAWPNRVDVGDTVTLIGTQLDQSGTMLAVTLGGVPCPVTRRGDTAVDITIPAGARSGKAVVSETMQLPDGTSTTVSSNGVPLLVVWTFLDTIGLGPHWSGVTPDNVVTPGPADSVGFCFGGEDFFGGYETDIYTMRHDRSIVMVARNFQDWLSGSLVAIDPLNGDVIAAVTVWTYSSFTLSTSGTSRPGRRSSSFPTTHMAKRCSQWRCGSTRRGSGTSRSATRTTSRPSFASRPATRLSSTSTARAT